MFVREVDRFRLYFGSAADQINHPSEYLETPADIFFANSAIMQRLIGDWQLRHLFFARQVHGVAGICVTSKVASEVPAFTLSADFLHTIIPEIGIGVMTADCLPIILLDPVRQAVAVIHAGWRGVVQNIITSTTGALSASYATHVSDIRVFFGPSAGVCCYQVGQEFVGIMSRVAHAHNVLHIREDQLFLDVAGLVRNQLIAAGVAAYNISSEFNLCTICDTRFYSHRRDAQRAGRQMTIVALR